jgi:hypothetical protein
MAQMAANGRAEIAEGMVILFVTKKNKYKKETTSLSNCTACHNQPARESMQQEERQGACCHVDYIQTIEQKWEQLHGEPKMHEK